MPSKKLFLFALVLGLSSVARADYGWIPDYQMLFLKGGYEFFTTSSNFAGDGAIENISFQNDNAVSVTDHKFFIDAEYGFAEDWAANLRVGVNTSQAEGSSIVASGSGPADLRGGIKYAFKTSSPVLTLDLFMKVPATSIAVTDADMVVGDGNFDIGAFLHTGHKSGKFLFALSPGVVLRFGGYSSQGLLEMALQWNFPRGYVRGIGTAIYSFTQTALFDSELDKHDVPGSAGSYAKLAGSPVVFAAGGKVGIKATQRFTIEAGGLLSLFGTRAPNYVQITLDGILSFDFFNPEPKKKIREIPLDSNERGFYD